MLFCFEINLITMIDRSMKKKIARLALNPVHRMDMKVIFYGATFSLML